jgi:hypothetical protein
MTALRSTLASKHKVFPFIFILDGDSRNREVEAHSIDLGLTGYTREMGYIHNTEYTYIQLADGTIT